MLRAVILAAGLAVVPGCSSTDLPNLRFLTNESAFSGASLPPDSWVMHSMVIYDGQMAEGVLWPYAGQAACEQGLRQSEALARQMNGKVIQFRCKPIGKGI